MATDKAPTVYALQTEETTSKVEIGAVAPSVSSATLTDAQRGGSITGMGILPGFSLTFTG